MEYDKLWEEYETAQLEADPTKEINKDLLEGAIYRRYCSIQMVPNTIKLAEKLISEGKKVIIATCYDDEINMLKEYFGERAVMYNGKMNAKQKDIAQKTFTENPDVMVFLGNIQAAGVGITLIVSNALMFNSFSYTDAENKQMEDRIYRIGQIKDVDIYYQMFRKTRCEDVWNICLRKEAIANAVIKKEDEK
jgi:SNF2 family DNA or RNA helicase